MATSASAQDEKQQHQPAVLLIAQVRAHLVSGESLELLPIQHERDVKHEVESLVQSWSESGFLLHGRYLYPWHEVRRIEVVSVEELPAALAHQRLNELLGNDRARVQESFWRTRHEEGQGDEKKH